MQNPIYILVADRGGGMKLLAYFDLQLTPEVRLHGLKLLQSPEGKTITSAAQSGQRHTARFARSLAEKITAAAMQSYLEATTAHDRDTSRAMRSAKTTGCGGRLGG